MNKNYHDPVDAIRDLLAEEYEAKGEEIREEDDDGLDWTKEIWVKRGGGTLRAKQLKGLLLDRAHEIIKMAEENRFSPSKAHTLYVYADTLNDFVNSGSSADQDDVSEGKHGDAYGDVDEPAGPGDRHDGTDEGKRGDKRKDKRRRQGKLPEDPNHPGIKRMPFANESASLEEMNQLNEFFGRGKFKNRVRVGNPTKWNDAEHVIKELKNGFKKAGGKVSRELSTHGQESFYFDTIDVDDADEIIMHVTGVEEDHRVGSLIHSTTFRSKNRKLRLHVQHEWRKGKITVMESKWDDSEAED